MQTTTTTTTTTVGLCLLPDDLLYDIFLRLPLPSVLRLRSVSTSLTFLTSSPHFRRLFLTSSDLDSASWLFLSARRFPRSSLLLRGFHRRSARWFTFPFPATLPSDLYLLAASASFLLYSSPRRLIAVDIADTSHRVLPPTPLGPLGTSTWRRSGFKLLSDGTSFRFLFAELLGGRPTLFEYSSRTDTWQSGPLEPLKPTRGFSGAHVFLNVSDFVLVVSGSNDEQPAVVGYCLPRLLEGLDGLHVYGDGYVAVVRSRSLTVGDVGGRRVVGVELWGLGGDGKGWEMVTRVEEGLVEGMKGRRYGVMRGCLEERRGVVRLVLVSNLRGEQAIDWFGYDKGRRVWELVQVGDCGGKGFNIAGFSISSSFFGRWSSSS